MEDRDQIPCSRCGKPVSTAVPKGTIVRAFVECPECIEKSTQAIAHKVVIDGVEYIPKDSIVPKEVNLLLGHIYSVLHAEAYYDPYNEDTRKFAEHLFPWIQGANKILKFTN